MPRIASRVFELRRGGGIGCVGLIERRRRGVLEPRCFITVLHVTSRLPCKKVCGIDLDWFLRHPALISLGWCWCLEDKWAGFFRLTFARLFLLICDLQLGCHGSGIYPENATEIDKHGGVMTAVIVVTVTNARDKVYLVPNIYM